MNEMVKIAREMKDDELFEAASISGLGTVQNQIYLNELKRRDRAKEKEIQEEMLRTQKDAAAQAANAASYAADSMRATQKSAEAAEKTADYTRDSARWMKRSVIVLALASVANLAVSLFSNFVHQ